MPVSQPTRRRSLATWSMMHKIHDIKESEKMYRPPKVRPKNLTIGGRYFYG